MEQANGYEICDLFTHPASTIHYCISVQHDNYYCYLNHGLYNF